MKDQSKTHQVLIQEQASLKQRIAGLEQAYEALSVSEQRMRLALEGTDQGLWEFDLLTKKVSYSDNWHKILGYWSEESKFDYEWYVNQIHPDSRPVFEKALLDYMSGHTKYLEWEYQIRNKSGEWQWIHALGIFAETDKTGFPVRMIGTHRNITARKRVEEVLRESEDKYRKLAETANDLIVSINLDGIITYANPVVIQLAGGMNIVGMPLKDLIPIDLVDRHKEMLQERIHGYQGTRSYEWVLHSPVRGDVPMLVDIKSSLLQDQGKPSGILFVARDITERKRIEKALRESEEKYRLIAENTADVISIMDMNLRLTYITPSITRLRGFTVEEAMKETLDKVLTPSSLKIVLVAFEEEIKIEASGTADPDRIRIMELEEYRKDGSIIWVETSLSYLRDNDEKAVGILSVNRDITKRKRAEEALRESEERFSKAFNTSPGPMAISEIETGRFIDVNEQTLRLLEFTREKMIGHTSHELGIWDNPEDRTRMRTQLYSKGSFREYPVRFITKSHNNLDVLWSAEIITLGCKKVILSLFSDITDRKRAEDALRISEERLRLIAENAKVVIWMMDMNLCYTYINPYIKHNLDYTPEEYLLKPLHEVLTPSSLELCMELFDKELEEEKNPDRDLLRSRSIEVEHIHRDGRIIWAELHMTFIRDAAGNAVGILGITSDITDRKRAEEEKRILEERLQYADKMESIGTLAGGIAHDFNNLLMGIQGYASLTLLDLDPSHPHYQRLKRIEEQVQSGADLTRQLLGFARGGRYEVKPADMNDIIKKTSSMFGRTKKEIIIHRKYEKDLWTVEVDQGQMEQVFMNLYVNAWQAMPGGGEIYLETENVFLEGEQAFPYTVKPGKYVKITFTDTGTGMDAKTKERIFDPFFTTKEMGRGTGLGLATVYGIIKGHKGVINVDSELGHGTTFSIYLPASEKEAVKEKAAAGSIARGTETILLVDDEKMVLEVSKAMLESLGYGVYAAGSGQEAIAVYLEKRNEIDLVILDMIMPGISGGETFDRLKEINPDIRVLLSSGYSIEGQARTIMDRGCNAFLQKPFQLEMLSRKVREVLGG